MGSNYILRVEGATVSFDGFTVLDKLNLSVEYGELRFLIGPNGAGKTTLLDMLTGKVRPSGGRVLYDELHDITRLPEHALVHRGIGRKFQTPSVYNSLTCYENLQVALGFRRPLFSLFGRAPRSERDRIMAGLERVGLDSRATTVAGELSHGERQWLEIGMLLVQDPKLVLLDEPVAGMTRRERDKTGELLHSLEHQHTIIITEHDMEFVRSYSRTVTVLHMGRVIAEGPMEQVQQEPQVIEVYLGRSAVEQPV
ncbi:MAG: urea ABC transporter ATP-binding protein UrtD [Dehalococcoidia bacterium]